MKPAVVYIPLRPNLAIVPLSRLGRRACALPGESYSSLHEKQRAG